MTKRNKKKTEAGSDDGLDGRAFAHEDGQGWVCGLQTRILFLHKIAAKQKNPTKEKNERPTDRPTNTRTTMTRQNDEPDALAGGAGLGEVDPQLADMGRQGRAQLRRHVAWGSNEKRPIKPLTAATSLLVGN